MAVNVALGGLVLDDFQAAIIGVFRITWFGDLGTSEADNPADVRCVSWFAKPALRSELRAPTEQGMARAVCSCTGRRVTKRPDLARVTACTG